jgi:hypothetical protein
MSATPRTDDAARLDLPKTMTPELKEKAILESLWKVLKEHEVTYDGAIRIAVRLIISCALGSDSAQAFDYAKRLLSSIARAEADKPNASDHPQNGAKPQ